MFKKKVIYIGKKILEPGEHFVLVNRFLEEKGCMSRQFVDDRGGEQYQLFVPLGYTIDKYRTPPPITKYRAPQMTCNGTILYVNQVPMEVKVYEKDGERFCPEFGIPVKGQRR